ncbi:Cytochrome P450 CYP736A12 [Senna tora]|uniref:Cytochrome P450 CYP736A12 n=1 Tax=Senna tora TaxID=362788 RepID=A0A834W900_9FABA|nr:Cytochrome P450 CYP736A12 [Senna tora]
MCRFSNGVKSEEEQTEDDGQYYPCVRLPLFSSLCSGPNISIGRLLPRVAPVGAALGEGHALGREVIRRLILRATRENDVVRLEDELGSFRERDDNGEDVSLLEGYDRSVVFGKGLEGAAREGA